MRRRRRRRPRASRAPRTRQPRHTPSRARGVKPTRPTSRPWFEAWPVLRGGPRFEASASGLGGLGGSAARPPPCRVHWAATPCTLRDSADCLTSSPHHHTKALIGCCHAPAKSAACTRQVVSLHDVDDLRKAVILHVARSAHRGSRSFLRGGRGTRGEVQGVHVDVLLLAKTATPAPGQSNSQYGFTLPNFTLRVAGR